MSSDDDISRLRKMRDAGEISDEEYDALRRHVLWGAPLPDLGESYEDDEPEPVRPQPVQPPQRVQPPRPATGYQSGQTPAAGYPSGQIPAVGYRSGATPAVGYPSGQIPAVGYQSGQIPAVGYQSGQIPAVTGYASGQVPVAAVRKGAAEPEKKKPPKHRGRVAFLISLVLAVALAGAGVWWFVIRDTDVKPEAYAGTVCSQVQTWHDFVTARSGELQRALNTNDEPDAVQSALATFFDQAAGSTDTLHGTVVDAGIPGVDGGSDYATSLQKKLADTTASLRDAASKARGLDIANQATFAIAVQSLQTQVDQVIGSVTGALASTSTPAGLRTAFSNTPACTPFTG